jgi:uncharacterized membrane protein
MANDNVTRFRPRQPDRRPGSFKDPDRQAMLTHGLAIACFLLFFFTSGELFDFLALGVGFAGLAIAASKRNDPPGWAASHHEFALRTILIGGAVWMVTTIIAIVPVFGGLAAWAGQIAIIAWAGLRAAVGIVRARDRAPIARPKSLFI